MCDSESKIDGGARWRKVVMVVVVVVVVAFFWGKYFRRAK